MSIEAMKRLIQEMQPPPPQEIRMHPDDFAALKKTCTPSVLRHLIFRSGGYEDHMTGLRIVVDDQAPKLKQLPNKWSAR